MDKQDLRDLNDDDLSIMVRDSDFLMNYLEIGSLLFFKEINETYLYNKTQFDILMDDLIFEVQNGWFF